jgi:hypothetical protein
VPLTHEILIRQYLQHPPIPAKGMQGSFAAKRTCAIVLMPLTFDRQLPAFQGGAARIVFAPAAPY